MMISNKNLLQDDILHQMNSALAPTNDEWVKSLPLNQFPLVFIVGAPRSGTTLLHQLLASYGRFGYVNNLIARLWRVPALFMALERDIGATSERSAEFHSTFGKTSGSSGPHEFGFFWRRWLRYEGSHKVEKDAVPEEIREALFRELNAVLHVANRAVVFKNLAACGMNAELLAQIHTNSLFLVVEREKMDVVRSILSARKKNFDSYREWFSVKPPHWQSTVDREPLEQIDWQIDAIESQLKQQLNVLDESRIRKLRFQSIVERPNQVLSEVRDWVNQFGGALEHPFPVNQETLQQPPKRFLPYEFEAALSRLTDRRPDGLPFQLLGEVEKNQ